MSYVQEANPEMHPVSVSRVQTVGRQSSVLPARAVLALLLLLAFLHGALYALFLPPWGLIDEAQHFHYIQFVAERQALPVAGELYLSDEIIESLFATRRWQTFQWPSPPAPDPKLMGLEGHSYEAYQPPLFYLAMTPFYLALPQDTLVRVYGLRLVVVLISLVTVWALYRTAGLLLPRAPQFPFWAGLVLVAIPERAIATSRINNDVLLEVTAALFFLLLTRTALAGLSGRRAFLMGLLVGLAAWAKMPGALLVIPLAMVLWQRRGDAHFGKSAIWALVVVPLGGALAIRNLALYGDLTGFGSFDQLHRLAEVDTSFNGFLNTLVSLPNHFWLVWWKGSDVGSNTLLTLFYGLMAGTVGVAWVRLALYLGRREGDDDRRGLALIYAVTILLYAGAVVSSFYEGMVPVIQGRFLLPALLPFVLLLVWGLWLFRWHDWILFTLVLILSGMGLFALFGNLVLYFYYWSDVVAGAMAIVPMNAAMYSGQWFMLVFQRILFDKPAFLAPLLVILPICYGVAWLYTFVVAFIVSLRGMTPMPQEIVTGDHHPVHFS